MKASEIDGILTLAQLEQMDGQRVLIPETNLYDGGFGTVVVWAREITDGNGFVWPFTDYGQWLAIKDPYGVVDVGSMTDRYLADRAQLNAADDAMREEARQHGVGQ